jgi:hypothetical protein
LSLSVYEYFYNQSKRSTLEMAFPLKRKARRGKK